jgi:hypothetical protein
MNIGVALLLVPSEINRLDYNIIVFLLTLLCEGNNFSLDHMV